MNKSILCGVCLAGVLLAACGGGGGDGATPAPVVPLAAGDAVPDTVAQSEHGMASWVGQLATENSDAKPALDVAKFTPPSAENTEPVALR